MKLFYDLHIHSCLSPCGEDEMTPNNIVNMSVIKGLDVISVTDHNHAGNVPAVFALAEQMGILCIPGMEVQTREEVHVLCYFKTLEAIDLFQKSLNEHRRYLKNNPDYFGHQYLMDHNDNIIGEYEWALISSVDISLEGLETLVAAYDGVFVPAHINKGSNSIMANLGFMPSDIKSHCVEIFIGASQNTKGFDNYLKLYNSDAHQLKDISEAHHVLDVKKKDIETILEKLRSVK